MTFEWVWKADRKCAMIGNSTERGHEMSLQMIIGGAGTRRSEVMYQKLIEESLAAPEQRFYLVVPEQYTMQTQMKMAELHPGHGVMNVDIVSFPRLAYRIFDELGGVQKTILEDTGKSMVIRRLLSEHKGELEASVKAALSDRQNPCFQSCFSTVSSRPSLKRVGSRLESIPCLEESWEIFRYCMTPSKNICRIPI